MGWFGTTGRSLLVALGAAFGMSGGAQAAYRITVMEVGEDVVIKASGSFNTVGLAPVAGFSDPLHGDLSRSSTYVGACGGVETQHYITGTVSGPDKFPGAASFLGNASSGGCVYVEPRASNGMGRIGLPKGLASGGSQSATSVYQGKNLGTLSLTPGTYVWTWGTGASADSLTIQVGVSPLVHDFNGDTRTDLVWQNTRTGERAVWFLDGHTYVGGAGLGSVPTDWRIAGSADFNGDGKTDIVWQNTATGERHLWYLDGTTLTGGKGLGNVPTDWEIAAVADFNNDRRPDLVWQNKSTGERAIWFLVDGNYGGGAGLGTIPTEWRIAAAADFDGDGKPDILWEHATAGTRYVWFMDGVNVTRGDTLTTLPVEWRVAHVADFDGDGKPDIVWENTSTGERVLWYLDGIRLKGGASLGVVGTEWQVAK